MLKSFKHIQSQYFVNNLSRTIQQQVRLSNSGGIFSPPPDASRAGTADLADVFHPENVDQIAEYKLRILQPIFNDYGGKIKFSGYVSTVKCYENNPLVRQALEEEGKGRVLVVDGGASMRCALLGDKLSEHPQAFSPYYCKISIEFNVLDIRYYVHIVISAQ
eukprot:TRINITY_DN1666_c1_g1_i1.p5 TRINITY_DN1666_c1_g1~~TRINITY_DN1666_c1_g1_i1.p5  ORF type:complete len:162 (-),score=10.85 TRINITY_DN1666_c1_g1_i1:1286-1771(-)